MLTSRQILKKTLSILFAAVLLGTVACDIEYNSAAFAETEEELSSELAGRPQEDTCVPQFVVQYLDSIEGSRLVSVSGASCQPDVEVVVRLAMSNGEQWQEVRETMPRQEGYFVVTSDGGRADEGGFHDVKDPIVCVTIGDDAPICPNDEVIPWSHRE